MAEYWILKNYLILGICFLCQTFAQDQVEDGCYGAESVVVAVIGTLIVTLGLLAGGLFLFKNYWRNRDEFLCACACACVCVLTMITIKP
ncbi:hypothetical protein Phum_PHUM436610 [Pediculus humanus corporis]|uniref:Uncharacterized protein n=1 Tax=Pediculus humanus subsp. corporis TaxID=121224 RepID=E0VTR6_PEDHC|nr:uncharacterized protein Phum_PHUM436610 [Pediculus humanus corporis]EEB16772.1 hypothetical protein Phum_PHUM436610 [Pediculus humanus corporis]